LLNANKQLAVATQVLLFASSTQTCKELDGQHGVVKAAS